MSSPGEAQGSGSLVGCHLWGCTESDMTALMQFNSSSHHSFLQGNRPDPGIKPGSPALQTDSLPSKPPGKPPKLLKAKIKSCSSLTSSGQLSAQWSVKKLAERMKTTSYLLTQYSKHTTFLRGATCPPRQDSSTAATFCERNSEQVLFQRDYWWLLTALSFRVLKTSVID